MVTANEMVLCLFLIKYREIPVFCHGKPNNMSKKKGRFLITRVSRKEQTQSLLKFGDFQQIKFNGGDQVSSISGESS